MKKLILAFTLLTLSSTFVYSEETETELMDASKDYILTLLSMCKSYAQEDEISKEDMQNYLLTCINDELADSFYKPISALPEEQ